MRNLMKATLPIAAAAALTFAFTPSTAHAQSKPAQPAAQKACTAQIDPASVDAGQKAVQVQVTLSEKIGDITAVSGDKVQLASAEDLPKSEMSRSEKGSAPKVVEMAAEGTSATLWLNTEKAEPGSQHVTLTGDSGTCTAPLTIGSGSDKKK